MPCSIGLSTKHIVFCSVIPRHASLLVLQVSIEVIEALGGAYVAPAAIVHLPAELSLANRVAEYFNQREFLPFMRIMIDQLRLELADASKGKAR